MCVFMQYIFVCVFMEYIFVCVFMQYIYFIMILVIIDDVANILSSELVNPNLLPFA